MDTFCNHFTIGLYRIKIFIQNEPNKFNLVHMWDSAILLVAEKLESIRDSTATARDYIKTRKISLAILGQSCGACSPYLRSTENDHHCATACLQVREEQPQPHADQPELVLGDVLRHELELPGSNTDIVPLHPRTDRRPVLLVGHGLPQLPLDAGLALHRRHHPHSLHLHILHEKPDGIARWFLETLSKHLDYR